MTRINYWNSSFFLVLTAGCLFDPMDYEGTATDSISSSSSRPSTLSDPTVTTTQLPTSTSVPFTTSDTFGSTSSTTSITENPGITTSSTTADISTTENITTGVVSDLPRQIVCGDGILHESEECDDALEVNCHNCWFDRKIFTLWNKTFYPGVDDMSFDNLHNECQLAAQSAGILTFDFKPLIYFSGQSAFENITPTGGRYINTDGSIFVNSFDDMINNQIVNTPNHGADGSEKNSWIWAGDSINNCGIWTNTEGQGRIGLNNDKVKWFGPQEGDYYTNCNFWGHGIYCIQDIE